MAKVLEEEAEKGIPREKLIKEGAKPMDFAGYLVLDGIVYEPISSDGKVPTHYRQRNMPLPQEERN